MHPLYEKATSLTASMEFIISFSRAQTVKLSMVL